MKKRLLAFALAFVMIISLLPVTAFAATPMPKLQMNDPNLSSRIDAYFNTSRTIYIYFEDVLDPEDSSVILGNKPVLTTTAPSENFIKCAYADGVATITFNNVYYKRTANNSNPFLQITKNAGSNYSSAFEEHQELPGHRDRK